MPRLSAHRRTALLHEPDAALLRRDRQVLAQHRGALGQPGVAEGRHPGAPHFARRELGHALEHHVAGGVVEAAAPVVAAAQLAVQPQRDRAGGRKVRGLHLEDIDAVQDRVRDGTRIVGRGDPDHLAGVHGDLGKLVDEAAGRVVLQQAVERTEGVVGSLAAGLVDLVHHHHRVRVVAVHERLEHLAGSRAPPLAAGAGEHPAGGQRAHRHETHAGAQQLRQLPREMRLAHAGRAEQQQRRDLERVAAVVAQRDLAPHIVQHLVKVGQLVVQGVHGRQPRGLDLEALLALLEHALIGGAQGFVLLGRQLVQPLGHFFQPVDAAHARNGDARGDTGDGGTAHAGTPFDPIQAKTGVAVDLEKSPNRATDHATCPHRCARRAATPPATAVDPALPVHWRCPLERPAAPLR
mmetsp:Transcript_11770/g.27564  ORF Transcript_11770/g.27564 Transcript_11770/m.27564 type:complete len:408 (+) Transcript_11770:337-1560(+)